MKFTTVAFLFFAFAISFSACKKDSNISPSTMQAIVDTVLTDGIDGNLIICDSMVIAHKYESSNLIAINGVNNNRNALALYLPDDRTGKFDFNNIIQPGELLALYFHDKNDPTTAYGNSSGTINIIVNNGHRVTGTINFLATDTKGKQIKVTEGSFDVEYDVLQ